MDERELRIWPLAPEFARKASSRGLRSVRSIREGYRNILILSERFSPEPLSELGQLNPNLEGKKNLSPIDNMSNNQMNSIRYQKAVFPLPISSYLISTLSQTPSLQKREGERRGALEVSGRNS